MRPLTLARDSRVCGTPPASELGTFSVIRSTRLHAFPAALLLTDFRTNHSFSSGRFRQDEKRIQRVPAGGYASSLIAQLPDERTRVITAAPFRLLRIPAGRRGEVIARLEPVPDHQGHEPFEDSRLVQPSGAHARLGTGTAAPGPPRPVPQAVP